VHVPLLRAIPQVCYYGQCQRDEDDDGELGAAAAAGPDGCNDVRHPQRVTSSDHTPARGVAAAAEFVLTYLARTQRL